MGDHTAEDLPFVAEYAKSSRASCKACKLGIDKDSFRIAAMVQSPKFDGKVPHWYHFGCFWKKSKITNVGDIKGYADLRLEDQQKMQKKIESGGGSGAGKSVSEYAAEYAKSSRSKCRECEVQIEKGEVRLSKKDFTDLRFGGKPLDHWYHVECFTKIVGDASLAFDDIAGYGNLEKTDRDMLKNKLMLSKKRKAVDNGASGSDVVDSKKKKVAGNGNSDKEKELQKQTKMLWALKDGLKDMKTTAIKDLLSMNDQHVPSGEKPLLEHLVDLLMFGALQKCPECQSDMMYKGDGYHCVGHVSGWTKCMFHTQSPQRKPLQIPDEYKEQFVVMRKYRYVKRDRVFAITESTSQKLAKQQSQDGAGKSASTSKLPSKSGGAQKSKGSSYKSGEKTMKMMVKGGAAVDPDTGVQDIAHVYKRGKELYSAVLGLVDVIKGTNSYYKLQLLESDDNNRYWVFRSWGRVGTTIGNNKLETMRHAEDAIDHFEALYEDKTGNAWSNRKNFKKVANKFYPLEMDYGADDEDGQIAKLAAGSSKSTLAKPIQDLIRMIFDVDAMKKAMLEMEIDLEKMPLGKLSKKHIESAYSVLGEAQRLIETGSSSSETQYIDVSNRFYTLIPHDFGLDKPTLLKDTEFIKEKLDMLDSLLEMEIAYSLLRGGGGGSGGDRDPVDEHYDKLRTEMSVVERDSDEWRLLHSYVTNTHGATHQQYTLEIEQIFKIARAGEKKRYKPFRALPNRMLLWHGSRLTNYGGILSQGLRIAPPEAPVTGYMFGKGVYFADMVSKSANYCHTSQSNPVGLLLLSEVALGNTYDLTNAKHIKTLPAGKHSVKGIGKTLPDPAANVVQADGVVVPCGKAVTGSGVNNTSLLYNEYIVYDVSQVNMKYLLQVKFNYKSMW